MNRLLPESASRRALAVLGSFTLAVSALAQFADRPIQRLPLDPMAVTRIPVARDRLTTIRFPSPVSDLQSALVATEPQPEALFLVAFQPGSAFFAVRALRPATNTTLNVVWQDQTCVLELVESASPWLSVIFDPPVDPSTSAPPRAVTTARLLGLLDTAKAYGLLRQQHPESVAGVEVVRPNSRRDYGDYAIRLEEVFRFDAEDTLVFRVGISNQTQQLIRYVPESLMVRVGRRIWFQSVAEATGLLPAGVEMPVYFAVTGNPDGSRAGLSPHNEFTVLFCRKDEPVHADLPPADPSTARIFVPRVIPPAKDGADLPPAVHRSF